MPNQNLVQLHGISTKFIPLVFTVIAFLYVSDYLRDSVSFITPEDAFIGAVLILGAMVFLYEGFYSLPDSHKSAVGGIGSVILFALTAVNLIFAFVILTDRYDPLSDTGDVNFILQIVMFANLVILFSEAVYEIILGRRTTLHKAIYS